VTASRRSPARPALLAAALLAGLAASACRTPTAAPTTALAPESRFAPRVPHVADERAAELASAALASHREEARREMERIAAVDRILVATGEEPSGLAPVARDLVNATLDDPRAYRRASEELLDDGDPGPALTRRLEEAVRDDELRLADARLRDAWLLEFGQAFNAVAEPIGKSIMNTTMAPYRLGRSLLHLLLLRHMQEPLPLQRRQALHHWKRFVDRHPDAPEADEVLGRIADAQKRWNQTHRERYLRAAREALDAGQVRLALVHADRALSYAPEDPEASGLRDEAARRLLTQREQRGRSERVAPAPGHEVAPASGRDLVYALLLPERDPGAVSRAFLAADPEGHLADEARFAKALAQGEAGREDAMWEELADLALRDPAASNMARHAAALRRDPRQNPYAAFTAARRRARTQKALWVLVGPFARGARDFHLPRPLEWLIDLPSLVESVGAAPMRLIQLPWAPTHPAERVTATWARQYLARHPDGEHAESVRAWLLDYEEDRGNHLAAVEIAAERPDTDPEDLAELREKAALQGLRAARRQDRLDTRHSMLRRVAREFPETEAGRRAGYLAREEFEEATPHHIRVSRGFLLENPEVAGPAGLDLVPGLLDERVENGELHPLGVALVGGTTMAFYYVGESGDPDDPPHTAYEDLSEARLARFVAKLEETQLHNALVDPDDAFETDAQRDRFFEKARLGLADEVDPRATARASYTYLGIRERYGLVRAREPLLPFDLVIQGSLTDFSIGAFPRIRPPKKTPDAFLYR